jgi:hypothetical protein
MTILRRPAPRFVVWAALLIGVAAASGEAGFSAWVIVALVFSTWVLVAMFERLLSEPWVAPSTGPRVEEAEPLEPVAVAAPVPETVVPTPPTPAPPPVEPVAGASAEPGPPEIPRDVARPAVAPETRWNVAALGRIAEEHAADHEELGYLVVYLRDFADAEGLLPAGFDSLVRESFGELLPHTG